MSFKGYLKNSLLILKEEKNYLIVQIILLTVFGVYNVLYHTMAEDSECMMVSVTQPVTPLIGAVASIDILEKWLSGRLYVSIIDKKPLKYSHLLNGIFTVMQLTVFSAMIASNAANADQMIRSVLLTLMIVPVTGILTDLLKSSVMTCFVVSLIIYALCFIRGSLFYYEANGLNGRFVVVSVAAIIILSAAEAAFLRIHVEIHAQPVYNGSRDHKEMPDEVSSGCLLFERNAADGIQQSSSDEIDDKREVVPQEIGKEHKTAPAEEKV